MDNYANRCSTVTRVVVLYFVRNYDHHVPTSFSSRINTKSIETVIAHPINPRLILSSKEQNTAKVTAQKKFDADVRNMICIDGVPLSLVNSPGFVNLVLNLDPKLKVKTRKVYKRQIREFVKNVIIPSLLERLSTVNSKNLNFTLDIWSSRRRECLMGVMTHFITNEWRILPSKVGGQPHINSSRIY